jgi:hypothetical protein
MPDAVADYQHTVHVLEPMGEQHPAVRDALTLLAGVPGPIRFVHHPWVYPPQRNEGRLTAPSLVTGAPLVLEQDDLRNEPSHDNPMTRVRRQALDQYPRPNYVDLVRQLSPHNNEEVLQMKRAVEFVVHDFYQATGASEENSTVVVLGTAPNFFNFFAVPDLFGGGWGYLQTTHSATHLMAAPHLPIAYELVTMPLRRWAFGDLDTYLEYLHLEESVGCMNDFYGKVEEMQRKLRSADICDVCMRRVRQARVPFALLRQTQDSLEQVRRYQLNLSHLLADYVQPTLTLGYVLRLADVGQVVRLSPKELAVYAVFAEEPQGIPISHFPDRLDRLRHWYRRFNTGTQEEEALERTVRRLAFNEDDDLSQAISRLNKKLSQALFAFGAVQPYQILGPNGEAKKIQGVENQLVKLEP